LANAGNLAKSMQSPCFLQLRKPRVDVHIHLDASEAILLNLGLGDVALDQVVARLVIRIILQCIGRRGANRSQNQRDRYGQISHQNIETLFRFVYHSIRALIPLQISPVDPQLLDASGPPDETLMVLSTERHPYPLYTR